MIDFILNHLPGAILYPIAIFFMALSFFFAAFQNPVLSQKSLNFSKKITAIYAVEEAQFWKDVLGGLSNVVNKPQK